MSSASSEKPKISCTPNGPYVLTQTGGEPRPILRSAAGDAFPASARVALCRCGGSARKPFCDGTHAKNGFSDARLGGGAPDERATYAGARITIHDNRGICAHAGYCTDALASVFRQRQEPWIDPDGADVARVVETIRRCPSGALSYTLDGVEHRDQDREPQVAVTKNGPYAVTGGIPLVDQDHGEGASTEHYTLCRCGASKNKPFCDGSHWAVGFTDESG